MRFVFVLLSVISFSSYFAQNNDSSVQRFEWNVDGQVVVATDGRGVFTNFGGPGVRWNFTKFAVGFNMIPSLRFEKQLNTPIVTPILGTGPQIYFLKNKRLIISAPMYYLASKQQWTFCLGLGFSLKKK